MRIIFSLFPFYYYGCPCLPEVCHAIMEAQVCAFEGVLSGTLHPYIQFCLAGFGFFAGV
jgi:hypothetical protein